MTTRLKFHMMHVEDVLTYANCDRNPYWLRTQAAITVADWLDFDSEQFTDAQLDRMESVAWWLIHTQNPAGWLHRTAQTIRRLVLKETHRRECERMATDDEFGYWLDSVATWRYDYHKDDYQFARMGR